jgi:uncharacterized protein
MPYLIDGHNLIPKVPGLNLSDIDDEMELVKLVQEFCRKTGKKAEILFDNAPPLLSRSRKYGPVTARFISDQSSADLAIQKRLRSLKREARNWTVVSSDRQVQAEAATAGAKTISADEFSSYLQTVLSEKDIADSTTHRDDPKPEEFEYWLKIFGENEE